MAQHYWHTIDSVAASIMPKVDIHNQIQLNSMHIEKNENHLFVNNIQFQKFLMQVPCLCKDAK